MFSVLAKRLVKADPGAVLMHFPMRFAGFREALCDVHFLTMHGSEVGVALRSDFNLSLCVCFAIKSRTGLSHPGIKLDIRLD